ncbi:MAG: DUF4276 family protein [Planctomycetes bacterium]|nr:DUF4276 family protein [Planctomycetota bacterium]
MKFILLAEGATEIIAVAGLLKRWLDSRLTKEKVRVEPVPLGGWANFRKEVVKRAQAHLDGPERREIIAVIGLLDLYGPTFWPRHCRTFKERHDWGVKHFEKAVRRAKFRMFFAVHEVEAWILSQPEMFPIEVRASVAKLATKPEEVNFDHPPSKRLSDLYNAKTGRSYKKTTDGKALFQKLDPDMAAGKCPGLQAMLSEMLRLAENHEQDKGMKAKG